MDERKEDLLSAILRRIPGFAGYVAQEARQTSDEQTRKWLADRLQSCKSLLDRYTRELVDQGRIDELATSDKIRNRIDHLQASIRSAVRNYRSFFGAQVDEDRLEDVYDCDAWLMTETDSLLQRFEKLVDGSSAESQSSSSSIARTLVPEIEQQLDAMRNKYNERETLLRSLGNQ